MNLKVVTFGVTEWNSQEYRTIGRFRGSVVKQCAVKDDNGKPALRATRHIYIMIVCSDGIVYRFGYGASMCGGDPSRAVKVHGKFYGISNYVELPEYIEAAHKLAVRRVKACLRIMRKSVAALPTFKPLPAVKVAS